MGDIVVMTGVVQAAEIFRDWDDPQGIGVRCLTIFGLLLINGLFVAAEYALVRVQKNQLDVLAESGKASARLAGQLTERLDAYLSACQLGITMASIALGWIGLPLVAHLLQPLLAMGTLGDNWVLGLSFIIAFGLAVFLHVVIGELIPKFLATHSELGTAMILARPLRGFYLLFCWPIAALNFTAEWLVRVVFRIDAAAEREKVHSGEELRFLVEQTEQGEDVTDTEREILMNALELNDLTVRDIMTPRADVVTLDVEKTFEENLEIAIASMHTRFPLVSGHLDKTIGLIHIKDLIGLMRQDDADLQEIRRDIIDVTDDMPLDILLKTFLAKHAHMALVKDEFGGSLGLVMLDDVVEELVGEIQDEFDEADDGFHRLSDDEFIVAGSLALHELANESDLVVESEDVSTVGGYVTHVIGHLPKIGEVVKFGGYEAKVTLADERMVSEIRFRRLDPESEAAEAPEAPEASGETSAPDSFAAALHDRGGSDPDIAHS